jgi:hypothetical protein
MCVRKTDITFACRRRQFIGRARRWHNSVSPTPASATGLAADGPATRSDTRNRYGSHYPHFLAYRSVPMGRISWPRPHPGLSAIFCKDNRGKDPLFLDHFL